MKSKGISIKISEEYKDFVENLRATRRTKSIGTDKKMLSQSEVGDLVVKFFKKNNEAYLELIKIPMNENV